MTQSTETDRAAALLAFDKELERHSLQGHWRGAVIGNLEPRSRLEPMHWRWPMLREHLLRAGEVIGVQEAGRRTIQLLNPGMLPLKSTTHTMQMSLQMVLPGEIATAHRHTLAAIRFVVEGSETFTTVEGDRFLMEPGDLILTPAWTWHDHINESSAPIIWIDGLDVPLARALDTMFQEEYEIPRQEPIHEFRSAQELTDNRSHWYFKWADTEHRARQLADETPGAPDLVLPYPSPSGGPTLPTLSCNVHMIRPRARTALRRHTSCGIYHVVKGAGITTVGDERIEWSSGDCFVVPNWSWYRHENRSIDDEAFLFFMSDRPILDAFSLYREDAAG